jgi:GT2 family glycosyltransferase
MWPVRLDLIVIQQKSMFRWLIVTLLALMLIGWLAPALRRWGFGKLPGDFRFTLRGREVQVPLGSTIVLSLLAGLIAKLI